MEDKKNVVSVADVMLRGASQVMFQNSPWCGLLFLIGIFVGSYEMGLPTAGWGALLGLFVSTMTGFVLRGSIEEGRQGLWGFNGILVGCALPMFLGNTLAMWLLLVLFSAMTTWMRRGFNRVMAPWNINSLTFPFVFLTWLVLLASRSLSSVPDAVVSASLLSQVASFADIHLVELPKYWLRGISQVFLIDSWVTGILFLVGLALSNIRAAVWAAIGSALGLLLAIAGGAPISSISEGLYGFSPVLTAIALATAFYRPGLRSALWSLVGIIVTVVVQAAMHVMLAPLHLSVLTAPFCVTTWLFLLPHLSLDGGPAPDHSSWRAEERSKLTFRYRR